MDINARAFASRALEPELATKCLDAFPHAGKPDTRGETGAIKPPAIVYDCQFNPVVVSNDGNVDPGGCRMLQGIGDPFLDDAVDRRRQVGWQHRQGGWYRTLW